MSAKCEHGTTLPGDCPECLKAQLADANIVIGNYANANSFYASGKGFATLLSPTSAKIYMDKYNITPEK